ncbi:unnamed protein product [Leptidea sinapis]|uniref:Uncharacterized protein n=1 Tax=Leptidea sinapis TaxID=189913 RepID=A0A5E4QAF5_9NEOP|nr:unnamed protein product [Leptidea sinapis]
MADKETSEPEDIPSDFFDDFNKEDFMEGLSVIDSWNDGDNPRERHILGEDVDRVQDLRELINNEEKDMAPHQEKTQHDQPGLTPSNNDSKEDHKPTNHLDDYIKPGSRRDPSKTKEAIKRDKQIKVKEYLAKHLEDDLRPPGTELDSYYEDTKTTKVLKPAYRQEKSYEKHEILESQSRKHSRDPQSFKKVNKINVPKQRWLSPTKRHWEASKHQYSPRQKISPHWHQSPRQHYSPRQDHSPRRQGSQRHQYSPRRKVSPQWKNSPRRQVSPYRRQHSPLQRRPTSPHYSHHWSPQRHSPIRSSRRYSPQERRSHRSRSPHRPLRSSLSRSRSRSYSQSAKDKRSNFPYPNNYSSIATHELYHQQTSQYDATYPQAQAYPAYDVNYAPPQQEPFPQPVPAPISTVVSVNPDTYPEMVPPPLVVNSVPSQSLESKPILHYDALAKLVADGKLSHEDYLKLAPPSHSLNHGMETTERISVINRCTEAISRLGNLSLPNRLKISHFPGQEQKCIEPQFVSPLKRQTAMEFYFSNMNKSMISQRNKEVLDTVITTLSLEKIVARPKMTSNNTKDVAVQTTKPVCEVCEIREYTKFSEVGTAVDPKHFSSSVHTQVLDEDLYNSKALFNAMGGSSAQISLAHLTPAQLVSQLAAKAKSLKEPDSPQSLNARNVPNYNYFNRRGEYPESNFNYRY